MKKETKKQPTIVETKKWNVTLTMYSDGTTNLSRVNDGFYPHELLGFLELTKKDIFDQLIDKLTPTTVTRKFVAKD